MNKSSLLGKDKNSFPLSLPTKHVTSTTEKKKYCLSTIFHYEYSNQFPQNQKFPIAYQLQK